MRGQYETGFTFIYTYIVSECPVSPRMWNLWGVRKVPSNQWLSCRSIGWNMGNSHLCTYFKHCNLTIYSGVYCGTSGLFISSMALKQTKIFYNKLKGIKQHGNEEKPLMKNIEQTDGKTLLFIFCNSHWFHTCYLSKHVCQKSDLYKKSQHVSIGILCKHIVWCFVCLHGLMNHILV